MIDNLSNKGNEKQPKKRNRSDHNLDLTLCNIVEDTDRISGQIDWNSIMEKYKLHSSQDLSLSQLRTLHQAARNRLNSRPGSCIERNNKHKSNTTIITIIGNSNSSSSGSNSSSSNSNGSSGSGYSNDNNDHGNDDNSSDNDNGNDKSNDNDNRNIKVKWDQLAGLYHRAALDLINTNINKVLYKRHKDKLLQRYKDIMKKK